MQVLIGLFVKLTGMTFTCASLEALAAPYACIQRDQQLLVLIALAAAMQPGQGGGPGFGQQVFYGAYGGYPNQPNFTPSVPAAVTFDQTDGSVWNWYNGAWH